jgi:hypothetical protein
VVQALPSVHPVPTGSDAVQFFPVSLHEAEQLPSVVLSGKHGSPTCTVHAPAEHVSAPLQKTPSLHDVPVCGVQVPGLVPLQVWQSVGSPPPHALVQQTESTQVSAGPAWLHIAVRAQVPPTPTCAVQAWLFESQ